MSGALTPTQRDALAAAESGGLILATYAGKTFPATTARPLHRHKVRPATIMALQRRGFLGGATGPYHETYRGRAYEITDAGRAAIVGGTR